MPQLERQYSLRISDDQFTTVGKIITAVALFIAIAIGCYLLSDFITPVVVAVFLAYLTEPLVNFFENRGVGRTLGIFIIFSVITFLIWAFVTLMQEKLASEFEVLLANIQFDQPDLLIEQIKEKLKIAFPGIPQSRIIDISVTAAIKSFEELLGTGVASLTSVFSTVGATILVPFMAFFLLKDSRVLKKTIIQQIPNRYFEMSLSFIHKASRQLGRYIRGVLLDAAIVGVLASIALSLIDLRYAVFIGILAGMANLIPYLGPIVGGIPAITISIIDHGDLSGVPAVLLAFTLVKGIDDIFLQPMVISKSVELHPVIVILAIYVGGHIAGFLGMIVAVPLIAIIKVSLSILHWGFTRYYIFTNPPFLLQYSPKGDDQPQSKPQEKLSETKK